MNVWRSDKQKNCKSKKRQTLRLLFPRFAVLQRHLSGTMTPVSISCFLQTLSTPHHFVCRGIAPQNSGMFVACATGITNCKRADIQSLRIYEEKFKQQVIPSVKGVNWPTPSRNTFYVIWVEE